MINSIFNFYLFIFSYETVRQKIVVANGTVSRVDLKMKREASGEIVFVLFPSKFILIFR